MNVISLAKESLKKHEGYRQFSYLCTAGKVTVAYGRNLQDKGISEPEAMYLLENDIVECIQDLSALLKCWNTLSEYQQAALIDLRFNLGATGFRTFKKTIAALEAGDFQEAALQIMNSRYADQVHKRADDIAEWLQM